MIKFSKEKVLLLHKLLAEANGGSIGVGMRDCRTPRWKAHFPGLGTGSFTRQRKRKALASATV